MYRWVDECWEADVMSTNLSTGICLCSNRTAKGGEEGNGGGGGSDRGKGGGGG